MHESDKKVSENISNDFYLINALTNLIIFKLNIIIN